MPEINLQLLPETRKRIEIHARGENTLLVASLALAVLVAGVYLVAFFYHASVLSSIQSVDNDLAALDQRRDKAVEDKLLTLYKKLKVATPLLDSHYFWSDGLARIEKLIQPQIQFKTFNAQVPDKKIIIKAEAASYTAIAHQLAAFLSDPTLSKLALNKALSLPTGRVEVSIQFEFDPAKVLIRQSTPVPTP